MEKDSSSSNIDASGHPHDALLARILEYGFDDNVARIAIRETRGIGLEQAVNWIIDHLTSNNTEAVSLIIDGHEMGSKLSTPNNASTSASPASSSGSSSSSNTSASILRAIRPPRAFKMIFVANMSLKMGAGKLAAQVGHATLGVYREAHCSKEGRKALKRWSSHGEVKIVVKGQNTEQLMELNTQANKAGLYTYLVQDAGYTQIPPGSRTVLGIFGAVDAVDSVTGSLKLL